MPHIYSDDHVFWYLKNPIKKTPLLSNKKADVVMVGGGMAGLSAAQAFSDKGLSVIVLEKSFCGAGASGKSSGFITPDSEMDLSFFNHVFGEKDAILLWNFISQGVDLVENNIKNFSLDCDYQKQDTLILANSRRAFKDIQEESETRKKFGYQSTLYSKETVQSVVGSSDYHGGVRYGASFGIHPYQYLQGMKQILIDKGVQVYEEATVTQINPQSVEVNGVTVSGDTIVVCTDALTPDLGLLSRKIYHAQTFIMLTDPLTDKQAQSIFPEGNLMVWDSDLVYQYYRLIENNRLVLGGASVFSTFWPWERHHAHSIERKLKNYWKKKFPHIEVVFPYMWPGLIGVSLDVMPIAGRDSMHPSIYYIAGATGLPWAATLGNYSAQVVVDNKHDMDRFFSPERHFPLGTSLSYIIGKPLMFAMSNFLNLIVRRELQGRLSKKK